MRVILETERLILREWTPEDAPAAFAIYGDPAVMRYIGAMGTPDPDVDHTRAGLERAIARYRQRPGFGFWAAVERASGEVVGAGLLVPLEGGPEVEVGYHLARWVWGRGYATELARALVAYGFDHLGLHRIVGVAYPANRASCRVLEKAGLIHQGRRRYYGQDLEYYVIERVQADAGEPPLPVGQVDSHRD
ncbi:MAG: GNAT family N-acetyltransferase [Chloroflexota bacterium]|nr:GNAT family N-acetyltransferase [Chloroflexota bacterium]